MAPSDARDRMNNAVATPPFFPRALLFCLSLFASIAFFDAGPATAQYVGVGPFGLYLGGHGYYRGRHYGHRSYYRHHHYGRRHAYYRHRHHGGGHRHHGGGHRHHGGGGGPSVTKLHP
jgi:hypothetical protein